MGRCKNEAGFALVITMVITALMVAVVVEMIHQVYVDTSLSRSFRDGQQASILAESGVNGALQILKTGLADRSYTSLSDPWAKPIKVSDEVGTLEISITEESSKLNINGLIQPNGEIDPFVSGMMKRLCSGLKISDDMTGAIADWLDKDDLPRSGGAESDYYMALKPTYSARNGRLQNITELSLVKNFTPERFKLLKPFLTIYSDVAGAPIATININTASKEILSALDNGIDAQMSERIIVERSISPFKSTGELSRVAGLETVATGLIGKISVKGNVFKITAVSKVKETARTVEAIVRITSGRSEYLAWQEF